MRACIAGARSALRIGSLVPVAWTGAATSLGAATMVATCVGVAVVDVAGGSATLWASLWPHAASASAVRATDVVRFVMTVRSLASSLRGCTADDVVRVSSRDPRCDVGVDERGFGLRQGCLCV